MRRKWREASEEPRSGRTAGKDNRRYSRRSKVGNRGATREKDKSKAAPFENQTQTVRHANQRPGPPAGGNHRCDLCEVASPDCLNICILRSRVFSANMSGKFFIAPLLELLHHFRERVTGRRPRRTEHPCTFGAAATAKTRPFNPYQRAARGQHWTSLGV